MALAPVPCPSTVLEALPPAPSLTRDRTRTLSTVLTLSRHGTTLPTAGPVRNRFDRSLFPATCVWQFCRTWSSRVSTMRPSRALKEMYLVSASARAAFNAWRLRTQALPPLRGSFNPDGDITALEVQRTAVAYWAVRNPYVAVRAVALDAWMKASAPFTYSLLPAVLTKPWSGPCDTRDVRTASAAGCVPRRTYTFTRSRDARVRKACFRLSRASCGGRRHRRPIRCGTSQSRSPSARPSGPRCRPCASFTARWRRVSRRECTRFTRRSSAARAAPTGHWRSSCGRCVSQAPRGGTAARRVKSTAGSSQTRPSFGTTIG